MNKLFDSKNTNHNNPDMEPRFNANTNSEVSVGVLTTPKTKSNHPLPNGKDSLLKQEMISVANSMGIFMYFFYPHGISLSRNAVSGHTYIAKNGQKGHWVRGVFPLPNIVYNRLSYRKNEAQKSVQKLLAALENNPNIHLFNSRFLDKWEVHAILSQNSLTNYLVPETHPFNLPHLYFMLDNYQELFIKPINNSVGKGIIKVQRNVPNKRIYYKLAASNKNWKQCNSVKKLYISLTTEVMNGQYLIQKGIDLATIDNRVFDLRCEVQKDDRGEWVFTGVGVRVAARGRYCTHVPNGGTRAEYYKIIQKVFGSSESMNEYLEQQLDYITKAVPYVLERNLGINIGILSIDIGIDKSGVMYVIEVNSKPSSFDESDIRSKHLENLNKYFLYLHSIKN